MARANPRKNLRERPGHIFFPKNRYDPSYRVFIKWNSTSDWVDLTKYVYQLTVAKRATDAIDYFTLGVDDIDYVFKNNVAGGAWVAIYLDYEFADTRIITARLEKWGWSYQPMTGISLKEIRGRAWPELKDKEVSHIFETRNVEDAISDVIAGYGELSYTVRGFTTETISANYQRVSGLSIIKDICEKFGFEWYIDTSGVVHVEDPSAEDSKITTDAITIQQNLTAIENFETNTANIKNRLAVNGQQTDFVTYLRTVNDEASQDQYWVKDKAVFDSAVSTHDELYDRCDQELFVNNQDKETIRLATLGMVDAQPGKRIYLSAPPLDENWHTIKSCSHTIDEQGYKTSFTLNDSTNSIPRMFIERTKQERELRPVSLAKVYDDCLVFDFKDTTEYDFNNCEIENGLLVITDSTQDASCNFLTDVKGLTTDANTRSAFVQLSGQDYENVVVKVSNDEGLNYLTFEGSSLNKDEKDFTSLDDTHRVEVHLTNGAEGSVTPVKLSRVGVYLEHDRDSVSDVTVPNLFFDRHEYYTDDQYTFTEYVLDTDYYDSTNSTSVTWDTTKHKITIRDVLYLNKIEPNSSDFTKFQVDLNTNNEKIDMFISFDDKSTWTAINSGEKYDIPIAVYSTVYIKIIATPDEFGTTGLPFPILFSALADLQGASTGTNPLLQPAIKLSLTKT